MRLWSVHPKHLDSKGLVALWREGLLARHVLHGTTKGYTMHPQLERFKSATHPHKAIDAYLAGVVHEAIQRGYSFDSTKIDMEATHEPLLVTEGQLAFEREHLVRKLDVRDPARKEALPEILTTHPLFTRVPGEIASWERP